MAVEVAFVLWLLSSDHHPDFDNPWQVNAASVDAFLWIMRVGESDGACRPGEPAAGQWRADYALALVSK